MPLAARNGSAMLVTMIGQLITNRLLAAVLMIPFFPCAHSQFSQEAPCNALVLQAVRTMPSGGGYSAGAGATRALRQAVSSDGGNLRIDAFRATPSYCSGATYLVLLRVLSTLQREHRIHLSPAILSSLLPQGEPDGTGIWGRWNANGPGTARLFQELALGPNFTDLSQARSGDFLKIFWNDGIGASEHGHSVIYLGSEGAGDAQTVTYWSSNIPGGFGTRTVSRKRIRRMLFSRLEHPEHFDLPLARSDAFLASLEHRSVTPAETAQRCGITRF